VRARSRASWAAWPLRACGALSRRATAAADPDRRIAAVGHARLRDRAASYLGCRSRRASKSDRLTVDGYETGMRRAGGMAPSPLCRCLPSMIRHGYTQCGACTPIRRRTLLTHMDGRRAICCSARGGRRKEDEPTAKDDFLFACPYAGLPTLVAGSATAISGTPSAERWSTSAAADARDLAAAVRVARYARRRSSDTQVLERSVHRAGLGHAQYERREPGLPRALDRACIRRRHRPVRGAASTFPSAAQPGAHSFVRSATRTDFTRISRTDRGRHREGELADGSDAILATTRCGPTRSASATVGYWRCLRSRGWRSASALCDARGRRSGSEGPTLRQAYGVTARASPGPARPSREVDALITTRSATEARAQATRLAAGRRRSAARRAHPLGVEA